jgi:periplasmic protein TonB
MGMFGLAGVRYPASIAAALCITSTLFWALWTFTDKTFEVVEVTPIRIDFTRAERPEVPEKKERVKPERPLTEDRQIELPRIGSELPQVGPAASWNNPPTVDLPPAGFPVAGRDSDAAPLVRINPTYPPREASRGIEGWVLVQYDITASGAVTNVVAVDSEPGSAFDKAAVDAVARWRYNPSVVNGKAIERIGMQTMLRFTLEDAE